MTGGADEADAVPFCAADADARVLDWPLAFLLAYALLHAC